MGGGDTGDGGAAERKKAEDDRQVAAIERLNHSFGMGSAGGRKPTVDQFTTRGPGSSGYSIAPNGEIDYGSFQQSQGSEVFDNQGYQSALDNYAADTQFDPSKQMQARKDLYGKFASDAKALQLGDLTKERDIASRDVSFDLARRGLSGGSRDIDSSREINDAFQKGVLTSETNAQGIANSAEQNDEKTRVNLIQGIRGGMNEADAIGAALNGMSNNAAQAANDARSQNIGGFFDVIRNQAQQQQDANAYQKAFDKYRAGGGGPAGSNGTVNSVN